MQSITAAYGLPSSAGSADLLIMEQLPWTQHVGGLSSLDMVTYLAGLIYGDDLYSPFYDCGVADGRYQTAILVWPKVAGLNYDLYVTHGDLGDRKINNISYTEQVQVNLETSFDVKYPVKQIKSAAWLGDCYDQKFNKVDPPQLTIGADGLSITISGQVYGTVTVVYLSERHSYSLIVEQRDDSVENAFSAIAYAIYRGWTSPLVIKPPPGAEAFAGDDCSRGGGGADITGPDDDEPPWPDASADRNTKKDFCTRELISDTITGV